MFSVTMRQDNGSFSVSAVHPLIRILSSSPRIFCDLFTIVPYFLPIVGVQSVAANFKRVEGA